MIACELPSEENERLADLRRLRDELREDLDSVNDSVRWLRSELRMLKKAQPAISASSIVYAACGLGALAGVSLAVWTS